MHLTLFDPKGPLWRNIVGVLIGIVLIPLFLIFKLIILPFERPLKRTPKEVAKYLQDLLDGTGGDWDWDDFTSCPIFDPQLEELRVRAWDIELPLTDEGIAELQQLLADAKQIDRQGGGEK